MNAKIDLPLDKRAWHPSPLFGQVVLVSTINEDGQSNVAPKSWLSMMAFEPPVLALGCNLEHWTARNILRSGELVINVPGDDLVQITWDSHSLPHPRPVEALGLTAIPAKAVRPPLIAECKAHVECRYFQHLTFGKEVAFFAQIVAVSVDRDVLDCPDPYAVLRSFAYLEGRTFGVIEASRSLQKLGRSGPDPKAA